MATINGNNSNNVIIGTNNGDTINAMGGDDKVYGKNGNDTIIGGDGNDYLDGGKGNDNLYGDFIMAGVNGRIATTFNGSNISDGGISTNVVTQNFGNDTLIGGDGEDVLYGDVNSYNTQNGFSLTLAPASGSVTATVDYAISNSAVTAKFGNDCLLGDNFMYGDAKAVNTSFSSELKANISGSATLNAQLSNNSNAIVMTFGNDKLLLECGNLLAAGAQYGDAQDMSFATSGFINVSAQSITLDAASGNFVNSSAIVLTTGNDYIEGINDLVYGDAENVGSAFFASTNLLSSASVMADGIDVKAAVSGNSSVTSFGADTIWSYGSNAFGDVAELNEAANSTIVIDGDEVTVGNVSSRADNNVLDTNTGNDKIYGLQNITYGDARQESRSITSVISISGEVITTSSLASNLNNNALTSKYGSDTINRATDSVYGDISGPSGLVFGNDSIASQIVVNGNSLQINSSTDSGISGGAIVTTFGADKMSNATNVTIGDAGTYESRYANVISLVANNGTLHAQNISSFTTSSTTTVTMGDDLIYQSQNFCAPDVKSAFIFGDTNITSLSNLASTSLGVNGVADIADVSSIVFNDSLTAIFGKDQIFAKGTNVVGDAGVVNIGMAANCELIGTTNDEASVVSSMLSTVSQSSLNVTFGNDLDCASADNFVGDASALNMNVSTISSLRLGGDSQNQIVSIGSGLSSTIASSAINVKAGSDEARNVLKNAYGDMVIYTSSVNAFAGVEVDGYIKTPTITASYSNSSESFIGGADFIDGDHRQYSNGTVVSGDVGNMTAISSSAANVTASVLDVSFNGASVTSLIMGISDTTKFGDDKIGLAAETIVGDVINLTRQLSSSINVAATNTLTSEEDGNPLYGAAIREIGSSITYGADDLQVASTFMAGDAQKVDLDFSASSTIFGNITGKVQTLLSNVFTQQTFGDDKILLAKTETVGDVGNLIVNLNATTSITGDLRTLGNDSSGSAVDSVSSTIKFGDDTITSNNNSGHGYHSGYWSRGKWCYYNANTSNPVLVGNVYGDYINASITAAATLISQASLRASSNDGTVVHAVALNVVDGKDTIDADAAYITGDGHHNIMSITSAVDIDSERITSPVITTVDASNITVTHGTDTILGRADIIVGDVEEETLTLESTLRDENSIFTSSSSRADVNSSTIIATYGADTFNAAKTSSFGDANEVTMCVVATSDISLASGSLWESSASVTDSAVNITFGDDVIGSQNQSGYSNLPAALEIYGDVAELDVSISAQEFAVAPPPLTEDDLSVVKGVSSLVRATSINVAPGKNTISGDAKLIVGDSDDVTLRSRAIAFVTNTEGVLVYRDDPANVETGLHATVSDSSISIGRSDKLVGADKLTGSGESIYGDFVDLDMSMNANVFNSAKQISYNTSFGNDLAFSASVLRSGISAQTDSDSLNTGSIGSYGDAESKDMSLISSASFTATDRFGLANPYSLLLTSDVSSSVIDTSFGHDTISEDNSKAFSGAGVIIGDVESSRDRIVSTTSADSGDLTGFLTIAATISSSSVNNNYGNDTIIGIATLVEGDADSANGLIQTSSSARSGITLHTDSTASILSSSLNTQWGADKITVLSPSATIVGDARAVTEKIAAIGYIEGGEAIFSSDSNTSINASGITDVFGNDTIITGAGNNIVYGDVKTLLSEFNSDNSAFVIGPTTFDNTSVVLQNTLETSTISETFGNDTINAAAGLSNILYGDADTVEANLSLISFVTCNTGVVGSVTVTNELFQNGVFLNFGADTITGGKGNDLIYGDAVSAVASLSSEVDVNVDLATPVNVLNEIRQSGASIIAGNDTINGGDGDDVIYGDLLSVTLTVDAINNINIVPVSSTINLNSNNFQFASGNDTIKGGNGNDNIYGDTPNVVVPVGGSITWGNDTLTGGAGKDVFHFDMHDDATQALRGSQGKDVITDMNKLDDTLAFHDVGAGNNTSASFGAHYVQLVSESGSDVNITFWDNSSLKLLGVAGLAVFNSWTAVDNVFDITYSV